MSCILFVYFVPSLCLHRENSKLLVCAGAWDLCLTDSGPHLSVRRTRVEYRKHIVPSLSHTHTQNLSSVTVCMAGKLMHAVQYFGYGGGASGLKVIFIFVVHFCNHHWILSSGFIHICKKFHDCWLLVFKFQLLDLKKDCSLQIKIIVWGLNSRPISPLYAILCLCFQIILAHHVL